MKAADLRILLQEGEGTTLADLGRKSVRRNALIADLLHRIGFIEKAGTGVKRIRDEAREGGYPEPVWEVDGFVTTIFCPNPEVRAQAEAALTRQITPQVPRKYPASTPQVTQQVEAVLRAAREPVSREELQHASELTDREHFRSAYLAPLLAAGWLEMTIPDKPRSSRQRYRLTAAGRAYLSTLEEK